MALVLSKSNSKLLMNFVMLPIENLGYKNLNGLKSCKKFYIAPTSKKIRAFLTMLIV